ncbi:MAG: hypothetical protein DRJ03_00955 [Chloroflexi bacterium]|nr:MAG: hypothetical protein DRJ03_00955 [Chloroflexota bacterium]
MVGNRVRPETEFTKQNVLKLLQALTPPTPTDEEHQAHWWNEIFGQRIRNDTQLMIDRVAKQISEMWQRRGGTP